MASAADPRRSCPERQGRRGILKVGPSRRIYVRRVNDVAQKAAPFQNRAFHITGPQISGRDRSARAMLLDRFPGAFAIAETKSGLQIAFVIHVAIDGREAIASRPLPPPRSMKRWPPRKFARCRTSSSRS